MICDFKRKLIMPGTHDVSNIAKSVGELTLSKKSPAYFIS